MSDEEFNGDDELEDSSADEGADEVEDVGDEEAGDAEFSPASGGGKSEASESEALENFSIASRQKARDELEAQIAEFLSRGGKINQIDANVTADPPKKPTSDYGGRPI